jgi:hypothetical protein
MLSVSIAAKAVVDTIRARKQKKKFLFICPLFLIIKLDKDNTGGVLCYAELFSLKYL